MCEKQTSTPLLSRSVIPCDDGKAFDQWAINIIGPMPSNKQGKKSIIIAVNFCMHWPIAQSTKAHDGNYIYRFIGSEIGKKFGYPKWILTDCGKKFVSKDTRLFIGQKCPANHHNTLSSSSQWLRGTTKRRPTLGAQKALY